MFIILLLSNVIIFSACAINLKPHDLLQETEEEAFGPKKDISVLFEAEKKKLEKTAEDVATGEPSEKPIQEKIPLIKKQ
jgi:hypothetical protein